MSQKLRIIVPLAVLAVAGVAYAAHASVGTLSAIGWESIALICPIGALGTMLASKMLVPRAVISLVLAVAAILVLGRAFCGWLCPVPVWSKLRGIFKKSDEKASVETSETSSATETVSASAASKAAAKAAPLSAAEKRALKASCGGGCASCGDRKPADSRHFILGGTLLSAAIFGFPVFCLVCPVGLSFAMVFLLIALFGNGDVTWSVLVIPVLLAVEVVFFRKWCSHLCPISSFMSLVGRANRTFQPAIDDEKCLETAHGATCGRCADVCEVAINPRHPELGTTFNECTRCRACADVCPGHAISFPLLARKKAGAPALEPDEALGARGAAAAEPELELDEPAEALS
ncbi:4Fe-4S binding protein [Adlercreutzia sp. R25]|uniref:4Fe-4S binding protein n=1 Tax=Adlercreutzia shanghongiae TaxID=3111773 RepID=UPI002DBFDBBF|nr:4Fe-4S binding protein [Adlercreutzia sp. R25]MEC4272111.1 4Fe-4S binding protein [Adlercreutzia sp. R25]